MNSAILSLKETFIALYLEKHPKHSFYKYKKDLKHNLSSPLKSFHPQISIVIRQSKHLKA